MAKKKKIQKTNAIRIVEQQKIPYQEYAFEWSEDHLSANSVAEKIGIADGKIFKTLVTVGNKTGPVVAVIPGNKELNLKKLASASGNKKVDMLHLKDLEETTGYIRGGCSQIGMKKLFPTYIAEEASHFDTIIVSAGKRGMQIELSPAAILQVTKGEIADISME